MRLEFHLDARREIDEALDYYEAQLPGLGAGLLEEIEATTTLLREYPLAGFIVGNGLHHFPLQRFPFSIYYAVNAGVLRVLALAHHRRKPGCWRYRAR